jgi:hypothetical protein
MHEELVKSLRQCAEASCAGCKNEFVEIGCRGKLQREAADAIESTNKAYQMISEAYEAEVTKKNWIPVTERLPEKYTAVLAAGNGEVACGLFVGFAEPAHVASWDLDNVAAEPVTHWMPLPEPPKEE